MPEKHVLIPSYFKPTQKLSKIRSSSLVVTETPSLTDCWSQTNSHRVINYRKNKREMPYIDLWRTTVLIINSYYMVTSPKLTSVTWVPLVEPINSYYMVIFPKLTSVTRVPLVEPINSYYMVIFPKLPSVTRVPLVEPINSCYMVTFPKLPSVTRVHLVEPKNSY